VTFSCKRCVSLLAVRVTFGASAIAGLRVTTRIYVSVSAMETIDLPGAASFLKMHPEEVRRRARLGQLPGAKAGKRWVFIVEDLAAYLRSLYAAPRQALRVTLRKEVSDCHSINAEVRGGFDSPLQAASELDALLGLTTKPKPKSCTTA
jgi:hypothetical protein